MNPVGLLIACLLAAAPADEAASEPQRAPPRPRGVDLTLAYHGAWFIQPGAKLGAQIPLRQWDTLPGAVHVLTADLPEGEHVVEVNVVDASGRSLPALSRSVPVTVRPGRVALAWARALPRASA